ncbi:hypothetical protein [Aquimarina algiphila]|uniref:Uncharacterized protein n=1 Tax=Aquimarina algiphila TaxID=2047982 RepID=A0A554VIL1_9FLAO|nr:hypothetical protein [Aquimarina algiphila]TSE07645.1 hypothetical protein FOF46_15190 [Aquimarina algiphila]
MKYYIDLLKTIWKLLPIALTIVLVILFFSWGKERQKVIDFKKVQKVQFQEIQKWKNKEGRSHARAEAAEINAKNAKLVLNEELHKMLRKEVGNLKRNLISYATVKSSTGGNFKTKGKDTIIKLKSLPAKKFNIRNSDLNFRGLYIPEQDTLMAHYKVIHDFDFIYYYKKPGKRPWNLFRRKRAVAEIKFKNHGSQADSLFTVILERRNK